MPDTQTRHTVAERAGNCCEYCQSQARFSPDPFSVEHVIPRSREGTDDSVNLAFSCQGCNNRKYTSTTARDPITGNEVSLFHPRRHEWHDHFAWSDDLTRVVGLTPTGRATADKLQLNRSGVARLRRVLRDAGLHPPRASSPT